MKKRNLKESKYVNIHLWLKYHYGKAFKCENSNCEYTKPLRYEYALIKGKNYDKNRLNYIQLCPSCHRKYDYTEKQRKTMSKNRTGKPARVSPVAQFDKLGNFIKMYSSQTIAAKSVGITKATLNGHLKGKNSSAGGYLWRYTK